MNRFKYGLISVWPSCWLSLYDNLIGVITLGYYVPNLSMKYMCWISIKMLNRKIKNGEE